MDCRDCPHAVRRGDGELVCDFTGAGVPPADQAPGFHCPLDLPLDDRSARDAIAAILLAAEKRGRLADLLDNYSPGQVLRLWAIAEAWVREMLSAGQS